MEHDILIEARHLTKRYEQNRGWLKKSAESVAAVDDINLTIYRGETLGVVGESGCGKSTLGRMLVRLLTPSDGQVLFQNQDITTKTEKELRAYRQQMQIVFQDPYSSLNPWMTIKELITEPVLLHQIVSREQMDQYVHEMLDKVGLGTCDWNRYPHQFSGGQRQRICIARALAVKPQFVLCDEPVSALDVSIQSQIINLLMDLQEEFQLTYMFISHSFPVIRNMADRVAVMYMGRIVELAPAELFFDHPRHPYSEILLNAVLLPDPAVKRIGITDFGELTKKSAYATGCTFYERCPRREPICRTQKPQLLEVYPQHRVACHCMQIEHG